MRKNVEPHLEEPVYLTIPQVAKILEISRIAVYKQVKQGKIKAYRIGRNFVVPKDSIFGLPNKPLTDDEKAQIEKAVRRTIKEYGWVLKKLGKE